MFLIIRISLKFKSFFQMKFKFDGVEKILSKIWFFSRKFERTQDVEMRSRSSSPMKVDQPRSNHISQTSSLISLLKKRQNQTVTKDQTLIKMSLLALRIIWSAKVQRMISMRTKASKKSLQDWSRRRQIKTKKLLWCRNICSRSNHKRYSWINTKNHL